MVATHGILPLQRGQRVEFSNALKKLRVNETSDVVETSFRYHIALRTR